MSSKHITIDEVVTTLRGIAADKPDAVNPVNQNGACVYTATDGSHCVAGEAFVRLGIDCPVGDTFHAADGELMFRLQQRGPGELDELGFWGAITWDAQALDLLGKAQTIADGFGKGDPRIVEWADAIARALSVCGVDA